MQECANYHDAEAETKRSRQEGVTFFYPEFPFPRNMPYQEVNADDARSHNARLVYVSRRTARSLVRGRVPTDTAYAGHDPSPNVIVELHPRARNHLRSHSRRDTSTPSTLQSLRC